MNRVCLLAHGTVSPWGEGAEAIKEGLRSGRSALVREEFPRLGTLAVGRCAGIPDEPGEDRAAVLLRRAAGQVDTPVRKLRETVGPDRFGVCAATSKGAVLLFLQDPAAAHTRLLDLLPDAPARLLARLYDLRGPRQGRTGACATGLLNVLQAADWIALGKGEAALAGSTEATLTPLYLSSFLNLGAMNRKGCHPWDRRHAGFVAGEGAAVFLLASERAAERAGIEPLAMISGWALRGEAYHQTATQRDGAQVEGLLRAVLADAGRSPAGVDLLAAHGTGTGQNDEAEARGLHRLYKDGTAPPVFGVKGAIGHLMGAAGAVELAACLAAMHEGLLPATAGFEHAAPECTNLHVLRETRNAGVRSVLKWNLGFGGHLAGCLLEAP